MTNELTPYQRAVLRDRPAAYFPLGQWAHVCIVRGDDGAARFYVNNQEVPPE